MEGPRGEQRMNGPGRGLDTGGATHGGELGYNYCWQCGAVCSVVRHGGVWVAIGCGSKSLTVCRSVCACVGAKGVSDR